MEVLKGKKSLRNGAREVRIQFPTQGSLQITQLSPNSRTHSPLSASADKEESFRTAVWFPVNVNGTPVELNLHFSVHKVCTCTYNTYDRGRFDRPRPSPNKMAKPYQSMQACMPTNHALTRKYERIRQQDLRRLNPTRKAL